MLLVICRMALYTKVTYITGSLIFEIAHGLENQASGSLERGKWST